jgi:hypothetical protein
LNWNKDIDLDLGFFIRKKRKKRKKEIGIKRVASNCYLFSFMETA